MLEEISVETLGDKQKRLTSGTSTDGYGQSAPTEVCAVFVVYFWISCCRCVAIVHRLHAWLLMQASILMLTHKSVKYRKGGTTTIKAPYGSNVFAVCDLRNPREFYFNWADGLFR